MSKICDITKRHHFIANPPILWLLQTFYSVSNFPGNLGIDHSTKSKESMQSESKSIQHSSQYFVDSQLWGLGSTAQLRILIIYGFL